MLQSTTARCYMAGAPQLVAVDRDNTNQKNTGTAHWASADWQKGGEDTTFTVNGRWGTWDAWTDTTALAVRTSTHARNEAKWLFPLGRSYNGGFRGVVYVKKTF